MYVIIEGIDTSGKSTQIELLKQTYKDAIFTKEPGGTELGLKLREIILNSKITSQKAEMLLFLADRAEHYERIIKPNKEKLIISDRGFVSGISYAKNFDIDFLLHLNNFALEGKLADKLIFLKLPKEELIKRISSKQKDMIENRGVEYLLELQDRIEDVIRKLKIKSLIVSSTKTIPEIHNEIVKFINED